MRLPLVGRAAALSALALLAPLLATPSPASADYDATCGVGATDVYRWTGGGTDRWNDPANWTEPTVGTWPAVPNDDRDNNGVAEFDETIVCIDATDTVTLDGSQVLGSFVFLQELHVRGNFTINIGELTPEPKLEAGGLIVKGPVESTLGANTLVNVLGSTIGGPGTLRTEGVINISSATVGANTYASSLTSRKVDLSHAYTPGTLVIDEGGELNLDSGVNLKNRYRVAVLGQATFTGPAYLAADQGTVFALLPNSGAGGRLTLDGDGGYYAGVTNTALSTFVNNGRLEKVGGAGTSVVDAAYSGSGSVTVTSGELALPDNAPAPVTAEVDAGLTFATGRCEPGQDATSGTCSPVTTALDPRSVAFETPASGPAPEVSLQELATPAAAYYPRAGVSKVVYAHADGMNASATNPARITLRYSLGNGPEGTLGRDHTQLLVSRIPDSGGSPQTLPDCVTSTEIPAGQAACVDRASSHTTGGNVYLEVLAQETSRWICRGREAVRALAPAPPRLAGLTVKRTGRVDAVLRWRAGADNGSPITGYRVLRYRPNGTRVATATGWIGVKRAALRLPRGRWRVAVIARNAIGVSKPSPLTRTFRAR